MNSNKTTCGASNRFLSWMFVCLLSALLGACHKDSDVETGSQTVSYAASVQPASTLVVFVHGVLGDAIDTWRRDPQHPGFPQLIVADAKFPAVDAMAVGYRSTPIRTAGTIEELAQSLLDDLKNRGIFEKYNQIIFVCHSMGGLVAKRAITVLSAQNPNDLKKIRGIIFMSTPSSGSSVAQTVAWVSHNPQFAGMSPSDFNAFLQAIDNDWQSLLRRRTDDTPFPRAYCAYELLPTGPISVVPRSASQAGCDNTPRSFARNHSDMVKPVSADDDVYVFVQQRILDSEFGRDVRQIATVRLSQPDGSAPTSGIMKSGDQYKISINVTRAAWLYVFGVDSTGHVERYFPAKATGEQTTELSHLEIPLQKSKYFTLDTHSGIERIFTCALPTPDSGLLAYGEISSGKEGDEKQVADLKSAFKKRGARVEDFAPVSEKTTVSPFAKMETCGVLSFGHV